MSLRVALARRINSPRFWLIVSALSLRAAGFVSGFVLVRTDGLAAMGAYSVVLNTAAMLTAPIGGCIANSSTVMARDYRDGGSDRVCVACVYLVLAILGSVALLPALVALTRSSGGDSHGPGILAAYFALMVGQLGLQAVQGTAAGLGAAGLAARALAILAAVFMLVALPVIANFGANGALVLASVMSIVAPTVMLISARQIVRGVWRWSETRRMLRFTLGSYPVVLASLVTSAASWTSSIYVTQRFYGASGVGSVAIALQWLTVLLLPATSWGGLTLDALNDAKSRPSAFAAAIRGQQRRNLGITLIGSCFIAFGSLPLAWAYGQSDTDLPVLFLVIGFAALASAFNNVLERAFFALGLKLRWFLIVCTGITVQLSFVFIFADVELWLIPAGIVVGGLVVSTLGTLVLRLALRGAHG